MTRSEREALKSRIVTFFLDIAKGNKKSTVLHFKKENIPERTIYYVISRYLQTKTTKDQPRSGRPSKLNDLESRKLIKMFKNKDGISQRVAAKKFNVCQMTIQRILNKKNIKYRK